MWGEKSELWTPLHPYACIHMCMYTQWSDKSTGLKYTHKKKPEMNFHCNSLNKSCPVKYAENFVVFLCTFCNRDCHYLSQSLMVITLAIQSKCGVRKMLYLWTEHKKTKKTQDMEGKKKNKTKCRMRGEKLSGKGSVWTGPLIPHLQKELCLKCS